VLRLNRHAPCNQVDGSQEETVSIKADYLTIPGRLRILAAECGERTAIQALPDGGRLTFRTWDLRSDEAAHGLAAVGVKQGDRVLLPVVTDWLSYAIAYVAIHKSGATAVPVLSSHGEEHVRWAQASAAAVGVISDQPIAGCEGWARSLTELEDGAKPPLNVTVRAHDDAQILFTSGTTGRPKGVAATHENILQSLCSRPAGTAKVVLHSVPAATNAGQGLLVQPLGNTPHTVLVLPEFRAEGFLDAIVKHRPTDIVLIPAMALALLRAQEAAPRDLSSVRMVRTMSAPISPASLERLDAMFPNAVTANMYASTESWPARVRTRFDRSRPASVGRPGGSTRVRVVDTAGTEVPPGATGEIQLKADGVAPRRYIGDPEASARVFLADGWVRTGDVGYLDADGFLYLRDREDDIVISGGLNVSTLEVAAVLEDHPQVIEAAAFGMPHDVLGQYVAAVVQAVPDLDMAALYGYARERLGPAKAPRRIAVATELPRTAAGKVAKHSLPALIRSLAVREGGRPGGETEEHIGRIWQAVLQQPVVGASDFLDLGGTSLEAAEITVRVRRELRRAAREEDVYRAGTLAEYAQLVLDARPVDETGDAPIKRLPRRTTR
jgi:acyl-CoA synthetase (AMP-forming)/AMP-acid ligase II